ncbi:MAG: MaoC/PaaZ C-terminal domain-containing protein [Promethearchaeota archaeon]
MRNDWFDPEKVVVDQKIPPFRVHVARIIYRKYNRIIKEINPIHINKNYAQKLGYEDIVVAGNFLFTYIPKWILEWVKDPKLLKKVTIRFENPVYIDEEIIHKGKIVEIDEDNLEKKIKCEYTIEKPNGLRTSYGEVFLIYNKH